MVTKLIGFNKNPNVGLYGFATDKYVLIGREVSDEQVEELKDVFKVPIHQLNIAGTSLLGIFLVGNENLLLVPSIVFDHELKVLDKLKVKYEVFKTDLTCLGNNIFMNEHGMLINSDFKESEVKKLKELYDLPIKKLSIADTETPGSDIVLRGDKALIHRDTSSEETEIIEKTLKVETIPGTVNMGVPHVKSGILCNKNGMIIGDLSGSAEIINAEESLGFIDG